MHGRYSTWKATILKKPVSINKMPNGYFPHIRQSLIGEREEHQRNVQIYTIPETVPTGNNKLE